VCTVSAARAPDGTALRVLVNRDERRLRMLARPPERVVVDGVPAVWPVDQEAGGTWAAVTAHGLAFALLNVSRAGSSGSDCGNLISRGTVIPFLAPSCDLDEVAHRFASGPAHWNCLPFQVLAASFDGLVLLRPQGAVALEPPAIVSTSSLGDELVEGPRRELFDNLLRSSKTAWQAQDRLHQHAWPDRRHLSVLMSRADACTVSRTEMIIRRDRVEMRYAALVDGWPAGVAAPAARLDCLRHAAVA
jgi:hypothetical protein